MPEPTRRTRTSGVGMALITYAQQNTGRILTINELMQNHPLGTELTRAQISSAMNNMVNRKLLPGLVPGKARGTWVFNPPAANHTPARPGFESVIIEVLPTTEGRFIGVDRDNARVYRMELLA